MIPALLLEVASDYQGPRARLEADLGIFRKPNLTHESFLKNSRKNLVSSARMAIGGIKESVLKNVKKFNAAPIVERIDDTVHSSRALRIAASIGVSIVAAGTLSWALSESEPDIIKSNVSNVSSFENEVNPTQYSPPVAGIVGAEVEPDFLSFEQITIPRQTQTP